MVITRVQFATTQSDPSPNVVLGAAPTAGNLVVCAIATRNGIGATYTFATQDWTLIRREACSAGDSWPMALYALIAPAGMSAAVAVTVAPLSDSQMIVVEYAGVSLLDVATGASVIPAYSGIPATGPITPTAGIEALLLSLASIRTDDLVGNVLTPAAGMTEVWMTPGPAPGGPRFALNEQLVANTVGTYTIGSTGADGNEKAFIGAAFVAGGAGGSFAGEPGGGVW